MLLLAGMPGWAADGKPRSASEQFQAMRYGAFVHNVYELTGAPAGKSYKTLDEFANLFDVEGFANQMQAIGVEYVIFTAWHKSMYFLAPSAVLDKWLPGHTAKRDLVSEIADALHRRGIALIIYAHPNDGHDLTPGEQAKVGYILSDETQPIPVFKEFINELFAEISERYSKKPNVLGFWWDTWARGRLPSGHDRLDAARLRETVRAHFPGAIILSQNPGKMIDFESLEIAPRWRTDDINVLRARFAHQCVLLEEWQQWTRRDVNTPKPAVLSAETLFQYTVFFAGSGAPGGISWAISPLADGTTWGTGNMEAMLKMGAYLKPIRESVLGVVASKNWILPKTIDRHDSITLFRDAPAYVATRSLDGTKEYVHVLKPPAGRTLDLTKPVEAFKSAQLLVGGNPVKLEPGAKGLRLTLGEKDQWNTLDTVIVLERERN